LILQYIFYSKNEKNTAPRFLLERKPHIESARFFLPAPKLPRFRSKIDKKTEIILSGKNRARQSNRKNKLFIFAYLCLFSPPYQLPYQSYIYIYILVICLRLGCYFVSLEFTLLSFSSISQPNFSLVGSSVVSPSVPAHVFLLYLYMYPFQCGRSARSYAVSPSTTPSWHSPRRTSWCFPIGTHAAERIYLSGCAMHSAVPCPTSKPPIPHCQGYARVCWNMHATFWTALTTPMTSFWLPGCGMSLSRGHSIVQRPLWRTRPRWCMPAPSSIYWTPSGVRYGICLAVYGYGRSDMSSRLFDVLPCCGYPRE
jgi:hypothetical protein